MYSIPLFNLNFGKEEELAVLETIQSRWISTGPKCEEFESLFAEAIGVKYALTTSNCTTALHLAVKILNLKKGDEVIVPSLTFAATANCVTYVGAKPVFADITSLENLTISPEDILRKITHRTKAIIVMHFAGFPCDMDVIMDIAKQHNLYVIEDASHAPLSEYHGKKLGTFGDIACYSFFSNKNMSTGEGGMLVTNNENYFHKAKLLRSHGMTTMSYQRAKGHATEYNIEIVGYNYRMDDIRAAIGIVQLNKLKPDLEKRQEIRRYYVELLSQIESIIIPFKNNNDFTSNYIMPIVLKNSTKENRNQIREKLHKAGIQTSIHYPCVHKFSCYTKKSLPISEYISDNEITLPMYSNLSSSEIAYITDAVHQHTCIMPFYYLYSTARISEFKIKEDLEELHNLLKKQTDFYGEKRIKCLILIKENRFSTHTQLAKYLGVNIHTIERWLKNYTLNGVDFMIQNQPKQKKSKFITEEIHNKLASRINDSSNPFLGYWDAQQWVKNEYGIEINYHTMRYHFI